MRPKVLYIAGPMSGLPQFNFPAFIEAAQALRLMGYKVISPAEIDRPEIRAQALASDTGAMEDVRETWGDFLSRDVKIVADEVDGVVLLNGWMDSRGAKLEVHTALLCGKPLYAYPSMDELAIEIEPWYKGIKGALLHA